MAYAGNALIGMQDALLSSEDQKAILDRQRDLCFYCEEPLVADIIWDHFIPRSMGGPHHLNNRVAACPRCDRDKGNKMPTQEQIDKFADQLA